MCTQAHDFWNVCSFFVKPVILKSISNNNKNRCGAMNNTCLNTFLRENRKPANLNTSLKIRIHTTRTINSCCIQLQNLFQKTISTQSDGMMTFSEKIVYII